MNRWDEIKIKALEVASHLTTDTETRDRVAQGLVELTGLMIQATGKIVAGEGEVSANEYYAAGEPDEAGHAHSRYLTGESVQDASREIMDEVTSADLERYVRCGECSRVAPAAHLDGCRNGAYDALHGVEGRKAVWSDPLA
jgi:hypothetical protein